MGTNHEFYVLRADEAAREAAGSPLANVRDRALRSEAAWRDMADRALTIERERVIAREVREERIAAETEAAAEAAAEAMLVRQEM
jgi:hypothetical protein